MAEFDTSNATATASDILNGKTAFVKEEKIKGTIQSKLGGAFMPTTTPQVVCPKGVYTSSAFSVKGDANLKPANIRKGVEIFGVEGNAAGNETPSGTLPDNMRAISLQPSDTRLGDVFGGGAATDGMTVTVNATPYKNVNFYGWRESGGIVSESEEFSFQVEKPMNLTAMFSMLDRKPCPSEYTDLEYVQSNGFSYINTKIKPTSTTKIVMDVEPLFDGRASVDGVFLSSTYVPYGQYHNFFAMAWSSSGVIAASSYTDSSVESPRYYTVNSNATARRMKLEMRSTSASVDGESASIYSGSTSGAFAGSSENLSALHIFSGLYAKIYSCKIYNGSTVISDFVPCANKDGVAGLYELITDTFYTLKSDSVPLTAGGKIEDIPYYKISLSASPKTAGIVSGNDGVVEGGTQIDISASTTDGYEFTAWREKGQLVSATPNYSFNAESNRNLVANFTPLPIYKISAEVSPEGTGSITGTGEYFKGKQVSLTANSEFWYKFLQWKENNSQVSVDNPYKFAAESNRNLVAEFVNKLPAGYTAVEYIESNGKSYINTDIKPTSSTIISMDVETTDAPTTTARNFFGSYYTASTSNGTSYTFSMYWYKPTSTSTAAQTGIYSKSGSSTSTAGNVLMLGSLTKATRLNMQVNASTKKAIINGTEKSLYGDGSFYTGMTVIRLLAYSTASSSMLPAKLYSCTIRQGNSLVRDFVPCISPDGVAGMYDAVEDTFYPSASTTEFTAGPTLSEGQTPDKEKATWSYTPESPIQAYAKDLLPIYITYDSSIISGYKKEMSSSIASFTSSSQESKGGNIVTSTEYIGCSQVGDVDLTFSAIMADSNYLPPDDIVIHLTIAR